MRDFIKNAIIKNYDSIHKALDCFEKYESQDPVKHCEVYLDKANGGCSHVDGVLCDMNNCNIRKQYKAKEAQP